MLEHAFLSLDALRLGEPRSFVVSARTAKARFEHGETDLHTEYEKRGNQCPNRVNGINDIVALQGRISQNLVDLLCESGLIG